MSTWMQLASQTDRKRVRFAVDWDVFTECIIPAGTVCTIAENDLNEMQPSLYLLPDKQWIRRALRDWDGLIILYGPTEDENWHEESPVNLTY